METRKRRRGEKRKDSEDAPRIHALSFVVVVEVFFIGNVEASVKAKQSNKKSPSGFSAVATLIHLRVLAEPVILWLSARIEAAPRPRGRRGRNSKDSLGLTLVSIAYCRVGIMTPHIEEKIWCIDVYWIFLLMSDRMLYVVS